MIERGLGVAHVLEIVVIVGTEGIAVKGADLVVETNGDHDHVTDEDPGHVIAGVHDLETGDVLVNEQKIIGGVHGVLE